MHFNGSAQNGIKQNTSSQIKNIKGNDLNDTPFGEDLVSNDTEHTPAIDLSGDSIQVESGRVSGSPKTGHDLFDDLN